MGKRYQINSKEVERLRNEVENFFSFSLCTPDDYCRLAERIRESGCGYISTTTLKRIWGYMRDTGDDYCPSEYSLRVLCNLIGFRDMKEFMEESFPLQSREYSGCFIECSKMQPGTVVELRWHPNRICRLRHLSSTLFEVIEAKNARIKQGDRVECGCFTFNAPAYFTRVYREGSTPFTYIAGASNGVTYTLDCSGS